MSTNQTINPRALISIVIISAVLIMFGAMIFGQLSGAVNDMSFMQEFEVDGITPNPDYDAQAASVVQSVQSNAWIGFSLMAIIILVIVAFTVIRLF